jgi:pyrroloquinoline quinone (PQQ) biosynthesis protein C
MSRFEAVKAFWKATTAAAVNTPWMIRLHTGQLDLCHYQGFLLETYHNTGYNPQLQAYASMFIPNNPRPVVKRFYQHAISEIGHDLLAMADLEVLGVSNEFVRSTRPLPMTTAFFANAVWGIQRRGPAYYLGYLFHLEFSPTESGQTHLAMLDKKGIPRQAMTFLEEHATVDIGHNKFMEQYIEELITSDEQEDILRDSLVSCVDLHTKVLVAAFENGEKLFSTNLKASSSF